MPTHNIVQMSDSFHIRYLVSVSAFASVDSDAFPKPRLHHIVKRCTQANGTPQY
jgi:hypothetical protein